MVKEEKMDIKKLQESLYNIGASITLIKMPAVIERIRNMYPTIDDIDIGLKGEIITPDGTFSENANGAEYKTQDISIEIDEFGMEEKIYDEESDAVVSRENGIIKYDEPFDGEFFGPYNYQYPDNATPTLERIYEEAPMYQEELKIPETLEQNREYLLTHYPITVGWFSRRNLLTEDIINPNASNKYFLEESENNRLVFYHNQIIKYKTLTEKEDKKINLLMKFAKTEGVPASLLDELVSKIIEAENALKTTQDLENASDTVLEKGRKSLVYYRAIADLKHTARREIKGSIIRGCTANLPDSQNAKIIMQQRMQKFFDEQLGNEGKQGSIRE